MGFLHFMSPMTIHLKNSIYMQKNYNLHDVLDKDKLSFKPDEYSEFKYGNNLISKKFGVALAKGFIHTYENELLKKNIVVLSSPYAFIPTASHSMTNHFTNYLNYWLKKQDNKTAEIVKIHRTITYKEDYGSLSAKKRLELIGNDKFHIDKHLIKNKLLLFLDDIKITGSHQFIMERMVKEYKLDNNLFFIYFAALKNPNIHPRIENFFNNAKVKSVFDLNEFIENGNFRFNTRVVKFILSQKVDEFEHFIENKNSNFIEDLYYLAIGNRYDRMSVYSENLNHLEKQIFKDKIEITAV
ncbi:phosphoribosyltransferase family protein [Flavobacteriales bacterium]|nr:phosphoribosyltransferase family protein [Flavobacteriales bacterium]